MQKKLYLTNRKTVETYSHKYIVNINNQVMEILSNFDSETFRMVLSKLKQIHSEIEYFRVMDCIDFNYTEKNKSVTLDVLLNYL